jgi:hypothetical protein
VGLPLGAGAARHQVEADDRDRQAVHDALAVGGQVEGGQDEAAQVVDRPLQLAA